MAIQCIKFLCVILALSTSAAAWAATYEWRDDNGVTHFTDNADRIPGRYLKRVKELPSTGGGTTRQQSADSPVPPAASLPTGGDTGVKQAQYARLSRELKAIQEALPGKQEELARLRHKWTVAKGRTPTAGELKEFEKKRAKGRVSVEDNPYINKNPLSTPGPARMAYYKKLEEIRKDEESIRQLEKDLSRM